jgi:hypothetical protein
MNALRAMSIVPLDDFSLCSYTGDSRALIYVPRADAWLVSSYYGLDLLHFHYVKLICPR